MAKYTTIQGDTWDMVSFRVYKAEKYIHNLIEANPMYRNIVIFPANCILEIPQIFKVEKTKFPPWRDRG